MMRLPFPLLEKLGCGIVNGRARLASARSFRRGGGGGRGFFFFLSAFLWFIFFLLELAFRRIMVPRFMGAVEYPSLPWAEHLHGH